MSAEDKLKNAAGLLGRAWKYVNEGPTKYNVCELCKEKKEDKPFFRTWHVELGRSYFGDGDFNYPPPRICDSCYGQWLPIPAPTHNRILEADQYLHMVQKLAKEIADSDPLAKGNQSLGELFPPPARARHLYLIGGTGSGKTTLLKNLLIADFQSGTGCAFIDPHGDAASDLLGHIPEDRLADVVYFAPASDRCPSLNPLALPYAPHKLIADIVALFRLFFDSWGPQLEMVLSQGLAALIADRQHGQAHTLADLRRLLTNEDYRDAITSRLPDEDLRDWWRIEFPQLARTAANPVLNKLNAFMPPLSPLARLFSNPRNDLDFSKILNGKQILLANLAKGEIGDEPARLLGGILVASLTQAALARATVPESQRTPFHLYADEFQTYAVDTFATILDETRKYGMCLTLANQSIARLSSDLQHAITANVGSWVVFSCSPDDAAKMIRGMAGERSLPHNPAEFVSVTRFIKQLPDVCGILKEKKKIGVPYIDDNWRLVPRSYADAVEQAKRLLLDKTLPELPTVSAKPWPGVHDIITLEPLHAIYRRMKANDVGALHVPFPPNADPEYRARVLRTLYDRYQPPPPPSADKPASPPLAPASTGKKPAKKVIPIPDEDDRLC